jgi:hypothetical protein
MPLAMRPREYLKLSGLTLGQMLEKLKEIAAPGELDDLSLSTVSRHFNGQFFPSAIFQDLYDRASGGAIKPQDWVDLARDVRAERSRDQEPERAKV